jgi:integrase
MAKRRTKGEGTIYKNSSGSWVAQITLPNGKRKTKTSRSQQVVKDWLLDQRQAVKAGIYVVSDNITVGEFFDRYMTDVAAHKLRPNTIRANASIIKLHVKPEIGHIKLVKLRPNHLQSLYTRKLESGLSKRMVVYIHSVIHVVLKQALIWGLVSRNVSDLVTPPRPKKRTFKTFTPEQVKEFLAAVKGHRWENIYILASATGMRESELLGLRWQDVDIANEVIQVRQIVTYIVGEGLKFSEPKSEKSIRAIPLPGYAVEALKDQKEKHKLLVQFAGKKWQNHDLVFTTYHGKPITPRNLIRHFKQVLKDAELPDVRFHDFSRHTHATLLLSAGVHPKVVQERLGHSTITLTLDTYSHVTPTIQKEAAEKIQDLLRI